MVLPLCNLNFSLREMRHTVGVAYTISSISSTRVYLKIEWQKINYSSKRQCKVDVDKKEYRSWVRAWNWKTMCRLKFKWTTRRKESTERTPLVDNEMSSFSPLVRFYALCVKFFYKVELEFSLWGNFSDFKTIPQQRKTKVFQTKVSWRDSCFFIEKVSEQI